MKKETPIFILAVLIVFLFTQVSSAEIWYEGRNDGYVEFSDGAGLEGVPYYPSTMARLDLGGYGNGLIYTGNSLTIRFYAPMKMYVSIIDFSPDGYAYLLLDNFYTAPGSSYLDWYVEGTVEGPAGREYLYLIVSTEPLSRDYLSGVAADPKGFEPEDYVYATDIESFQVIQGTGSNSYSREYSPFVEITGTPLEVYPTYYIFPRDRYYHNPYVYYYYYMPDNYYNRGKYYRVRIGVGGKSYYAYPSGGVPYYNFGGLHTSGRIIDDRWEIIPGGFIRGGFTIGTVSSPIGLVVYPYMPGGFYQSYNDWGSDFTFEIWVNDQKQGYGYIVNDVDGKPMFYSQMDPGALVEGENEFEIRVPKTGRKMEIERIEIVEADEPEEVDTEDEDSIDWTPSSPQSRQ